MKYYGICPASCGEFVQGVMDRAEYICSYAVDLYSTAEVEEKLNNINLGPLKSRKAIEAVFKKFNIPVEESKNISLKIRSKIPVGKGMASSTADIGATIGATLGLIKKELSSEEIAKLASTIEPTDSIYIEKNSIFNPLNGEVIRHLGHVKDLRGLEKIIEISKNYGAYGVNVAHSGTVVGILIDKSMDDTRLIELLRNVGLDSVYKKMYTSNIIDGGIRAEQAWI